jgi:predicted phage terminase large subunit-like protein
MPAPRHGQTRGAAARTASRCLFSPIAFHATLKLLPFSRSAKGLCFGRRFGEAEVAALEASLGPYMAAGRLQQAPAPKGGSIIRSEWFQLWDRHGNNDYFPPPSFRVAALDGAWTEDESNDPSALVVIGIWKPPDVNAPRVLVMEYWRKWVPLHGQPTHRMPDELSNPGDTEALIRQRNAKYRQRVSTQWGLIEHVRATCLRLKVDLLLVEKAASGYVVASELMRFYSGDGILVELITPKGDKVARAHAIVPILTEGLVYAPAVSWVDDLLLPELASFPNGRHDDLVDATTMALSYLRRHFYLQIA